MVWVISMFSVHYYEQVDHESERVAESLKSKRNRYEYEFIVQEYAITDRSYKIGQTSLSKI